MVREPEYISLKEAAQLSGYSADYVGQLIRSGKLHGKQVFLNVAWMTTKEAILEYSQKEKKQATESDFIADLKEKFMSLEGLSFIYMWGMRALIAVLVLLLSFLAYVFAVSIDHQIEASYQAKIEYDR